MTLDEQIPQDIKELIVQQAIIQSNSAQQADQTIANLSRTSRSWHATLHPYTSQQLGCNDMVQTVKIKCTNTITTIINNMMFLSVADYRVTYNKTKPSVDEYAAIIAYIASPMPALDAQFKNTFDLLTDYYINTFDASCACFYDLLKLYKLNRQYPTDPTIAPQTALQTKAALKKELQHASKKLILDYVTNNRVKRLRICEVIEFLQSKDLFTAPAINLHKHIHFIIFNSLEHHLNKFLSSDACIQEDIIFLNQAIHLKTLLRYSFKQSKTENKYHNPLPFLLQTTATTAVFVKIALTLSAIIAMRSMGAKSVLYTLSKMCGSSIVNWTEIFAICYLLRNENFGHQSLPPLILISVLTYKIIKTLGKKCLLTLLKVSPLLLIPNIINILYRSRQEEASYEIIQSLNRRGFAI
jgi:hypothetical protein